MSRFRFAPRVLSLDPAPGVDRLLHALARRPGLAVLDGADGAPARWSVVAFEPLDGVELPPDVAGLRALVAGLEPAPGDPPPGPFHGGFLGALAYDLGVSGERLALPRDPTGAPPIVGGLYTDFVVVDHDSGSAWLVLGDTPGDGRASVRARREAVLDTLGGDPPPSPVGHGVGPLVRHVPPAEHRRRIERARVLIRAGEIYQANLAHRFTRRVAGHPVEQYRRLRRVNPAPYMGYLAWGPSGERPDGALLSASPELLLDCDGRRARTRPIKGTAGRGTTPEEDARNRERLLASAKDRAELAMIVDLERNDLGRVARPGSVRVSGFPTLESYAAVHHLVADVACELAPGRDAVAALAALFPGGSITGAPKLRAMEAIAELEGEGRGFFTGSLGRLDTRGQAAFNILIRTLVWRPREGEGEVSFHVGGGITWRSDPEAEERETLDKGAALSAALAGPGEVADTLGAPLAPPPGS